MTSPSSTHELIVGVYGSSATQFGSPEYKDAVRLGQALAVEGYAVMTGGYAGMMGAISEGAALVNGHIIGVTVGTFRQRGLTPNKYLLEEVELPTLSERLNYLIIKPDAYVFVHGGVGTLAELALAWSLVQVGEVPPRPVICQGRVWKELVKGFVPYAAIRPVDDQYLTLVDEVDEIVPALKTWYANPPRIPSKIGDVTIPPLLGDTPKE